MDNMMLNSAHVASTVDLVQVFHICFQKNMSSKKIWEIPELAASNSDVFRAGINRKHVFAMI